jgi:dual oxidase
VDFHWIVKDRNYLSWFSDLLNEISKSSSVHCNDANPHLDIHIATHVTQKRKNLSIHVFRYLLECHRTKEHPASPLTGLLNPTHFGRPDLGQIMNDHYESILKLYKELGEKGADVKTRKVGVFFCGAPPIGRELADRCQVLRMRGREDKSYIEYHFMMEVFG